MNNVFNTILQGGNTANQSNKNRVWYYQLPNQPKRKLYKSGKYWYYMDGTQQTGCSKLVDAKGDIKFSGGSVWSELI